MDIKEKILLMECPPLGKIISRVSQITNIDYPSVDIFPIFIIESSECLINVLLNIEDYVDDLEEFIGHMESLDLLDDFNEAIIMIKNNKDSFSIALSDIKIYTKTGLTGLIFRH